MSPLDLVDLLGGTLVRGGLILAAAFLGSWLLRRRSAAGRYAVWTAAFAGLALLPALTLMLPVLEPPTLGRAKQMAASSRSDAETMVMARASAEAAHSLAVRSGAERMRFVAGGMTGPVAAIRPDRARFGKPDWSRVGQVAGPLARRAAPWLLGLWLAGALFVLARLARDIRRIAQVAGRAATLQRGPLANLLREVAADMGIRRPVVVIAISRELAVPVTWGIRRPVVLLPAAARRWDAERQRVVLRHELAHIRRGDYAGHLLIELACALHWPNPFAWRAAYRARLEQEQACDDRVVALGTGPIDYAQQLLDIARAFVSPAVPERGALAMAAAATLPERMRSILDVGLDHRPAGRRTLLAVAGAAMLVGVPTAALHPWSVGPREADLIASLGSMDPVADGSEPNKLVVVTADIALPRVASAEAISTWSEQSPSPWVSAPVKTLVHPGEVNKMLDLPHHPSMLVTHSDSPHVFVWDLDVQPDRAGDLGARG